MRPRLSLTNQPQTTTKRIVAYCGFVSLSFLATVWFGLHQRLQAPKNILPDHQVHAAPTKIQPKLVASYGKLPLSFEANHGQTDARVRFLARGGGYTIFLTDDEPVLTLRKSQPGMSRFGKFGFPGRLELFGPVDPRASRWPSLGDDLKSPSLIPDLSQMVPEPNAGKGGGARGPESQPPQVMRMRLVGGNAKGRVVGLDELPGRSNYFIGNDPKKWRTNVPTYARVKYQGVYPGVDLVYYGNQGGQLEFDFVVAPGADPNQIKLSFAGADGIRVDAASGDLVLNVGDDEVRIHKPAVYQPAVTAKSSSPSSSVAPSSGDDARHSLLVTRHSSFVLASNHQVVFRVAGYDRRRALVIDPILSYSTFLGGSNRDFATGIAVDSSGSAYVTGWTSSADFPTVNPIQTGGGVFVSKLNPDGSALVYSTYLGGGNDQKTAIAVDAAGNAYVTGSPASADFPVTPGAFQTISSGGAPAFVSKLNADGSALVYSTYLGGSGQEIATGIALDSSGNAYVTGSTYSADFPTVNPIQTGEGFFVSKLNAAGSALLYSTTLGGFSALHAPEGGPSGSANGIAVDTSGNAYVTGFTYSTDFPVTPGAFQTTVGPPCGYVGGPIHCAHVVVFKLNAAGSALVYSTYLRGSGYDYGYGIAVDSSRHAYVTGVTQSSNFPTVNPIQAACPGCQFSGGSVFVTKLNAAGSGLVYSTYLGGSDYDRGSGIAVDSSGDAYITGFTGSTDFPTVNAIQPTCDGLLSNQAAFVTELNADGSALLYSTYLGCSNYVLYYSAGALGSGIAVDSSGNAYVTGTTGAPDFLVANPLQATIHGLANAFVARISSSALGPWVILSSLSLPFGSQNVNTTSPALTETVRNGGTADLAISSTTIEGTDVGDFAISADSCTGATVPAGGACTVNVTFTPSANGTRSASLNFTNNASNSPQTVNLTGAGGATAPVASVSPSSLAFGGQPVVYMAASLPVTVSNTGNAPLIITNIMTSPDFPALAGGIFRETDDCRNGVAAGGACTITVSFSPRSAGPVTGTLTIIDNSNGVEGRVQTVALSGTGQDFTLTIASGSSDSATVVRGQSATFTLTLAGQEGFNKSVTFTCVGVPDGTPCTVSPNPVTVGSSPTNVTVTVTTIAPSASAPRFGPLPPVPPLSPGLRVVLMLALALAAMAWAAGRRNPRGLSRRQSAMVPLASGLLLALALAGCGGGGGGGGGGGPHDSGTPAGTYTLNVQGTSVSGPSALSHYVTLTLTVS